MYMDDIIIYVITTTLMRAQVSDNNKFPHKQEQNETRIQDDFID